MTRGNASPVEITAVKFLVKCCKADHLSQISCLLGLQNRQAALMFHAEETAHGGCYIATTGLSPCIRQYIVTDNFLRVVGPFKRGKRKSLVSPIPLPIDCVRKALASITENRATYDRLPLAERAYVHLRVKCLHSLCSSKIAHLSGDAAAVCEIGWHEFVCTCIKNLSI